MTLKAQLGLGHVELSQKYDRHATRTCGGRGVTVGDLQRHAVGGVQLVRQSWDPMSPHPVYTRVRGACLIIAKLSGIGVVVLAL